MFIFTIIGVITAIYLIIRFGVEIAESNMENNKHTRELYDIFSREDKNCFPHKLAKFSYSYYPYWKRPSVFKINRFLSKNPEKRKKYEDMLKRKKMEDELFHDRERKRNTKLRVFAYDYEDLLFQIYAPFAYRHRIYNDWTATGVRIEKDDIIKKICEIKKISQEDAEIIFQILLDNQLLLKNKNGGYGLTSMLEKHTGIDPQMSWDIISDKDMNLDKWMFLNGYDRNS